MIRLLGERETGLLSPLILKRAEIARRNFSLQLSKHKDVEGILKGSVNSLDLDVAESRYMLSGSHDSSILIHDVRSSSREQRQTFGQVASTSHNKGSHKFSVETVQWYPMDTGLFTTSGGDKHLKIWDSNRLKLADSYKFQGLVFNHHMSRVARKHCLIAVASERSAVKLVDMKSGSASHQLKGHDATVCAVQWSARDEFLLASGGMDGKVMLWDIRRAKGCLLTLDQHNGQQGGKHYAKSAHDGFINSLQFTPDGLHLVTFGTDHQVRLWNATNGVNLYVNYGTVFNTIRKNGQMCVTDASSPPVLFVPSDSNVEVFDLFKGVRLASLAGHYNVVNCCVSHPDSNYLFSGGKDRNILIWVPATETEDYEEHLSLTSRQGQGESQEVKAAGVQPNPLTTDAWSSDEEG